MPQTIQTQFHHAGRCGSRTRTPYIQDIDNKCPGMSVRVFALLRNQTPVLGRSRRNQSRMVTAHTAPDLVNARDEHWSMRPHSFRRHDGTVRSRMFVSAGTSGAHCMSAGCVSGRLRTAGAGVVRFVNSIAHVGSQPSFNNPNHRYPTRDSCYHLA